MDQKRLGEIRERLRNVSDKRTWKYNPKHEMFMGTTNAVEMYDRTLDLGRGAKQWRLSEDPDVKGYVLSEQSRREILEIRNLGEFIANCREDIAWLLEQIPHAEQ